MQYLQIIGSVLLSIGGGGAIVLGLSSWLGKIWANRLMESERYKYAKDIEEYKSNLDKEFARISATNEKAMFVSKLQYEKEFSIYLELWEAVHYCEQYSSLLYPFAEDVPSDEMKKEEFHKQKYKQYVEAYNELIKMINKYKPFYDERFDGVLEDIRFSCARLGSIFKIYNFDVKYSVSYTMARDTQMTAKENEDVYTNIPEKLKKDTASLRSMIRDYLRYLQAVDQS